MEFKLHEKQPIRATLREMSVGDEVRFPVSRLSVLRAAASSLGVEMQRKYVTHLDRKSMTINVSRQK